MTSVSSSPSSAAPVTARAGAQHSNRTHPIIIRRLTVSRVTDVTPRMRRVTLTGEQLADFTVDGMPMAPFVSTGFDDHVKIVLASAGPVESVLPQQLPHAVEWHPCEQRIMRDYTPRRFDAAAGELDLDFVRHGDGPAATWAEQVSAGDTLHIVGPKSSLLLPTEVDRVVLVGDETALPAIGRYLDERPLPVPVDVVVQIGHLDARQELALTDRDTVSWLTGDSRDPAAGEALVAAARSVIDRPGTPFVWAGGENRAMLALRRWCHREQGLAKHHTKIIGYWTADPVVEAVAPVDADELLSPLPYLATRAALRTGVLGALAAGPRTPADLATDLGLAAGPLEPLLDYLLAVGVLQAPEPGTGDGDALVLGPVGEAVLDDDHLRNSLDETVEADVIDALIRLPDTLRGKQIGFGSAADHSIADLITRRSDAYAELITGADGLSFTGHSIRELPLLRDAAAVTLTGPGAAPLAGVLAGLPVTVVDASEVLDQVRAALTAEVPVLAEGTEPPAEVTVAASALGHRTDAEAAAVLEHVRTDHLVLIEEVYPRSPHDDHAAEHALLAAAMRGRRDADDYRRLLEDHGWECLDALEIGWNFTAWSARRNLLR